MGCSLTREALALSNLLTSSASALLSGGGAALSAWNASGFMSVVSGLGDGARELDDAVLCVVGLAMILVVLNIVGASVVCASTFDCGSLCCTKRVQAMTSSRSFCFGHFAVWITFLAQLLLTQVVLMAVVVCTSLLYVCHAGRTVQYNSQQLVNEIANEINGPDYDQSGMPIARIPDTPIVSMRELILSLDIQRFCASGQDHGTKAVAFYIGCLMVSVAQVSLACALWGESQRVAVHEVTETSVAAPFSKYSYANALALDVGERPATPGSGRYLQDACSSATKYPYTPAMDTELSEHHLAPLTQSRASPSSRPFSVSPTRSSGRFQRDDSLFDGSRYNLDFRESASKVEYF